MSGRVEVSGVVENERGSRMVSFLVLFPYALMFAWAVPATAQPITFTVEDMVPACDLAIKLARNEISNLSKNQMLDGGRCLGMVVGVSQMSGAAERGLKACAPHMSPRQIIETSLAFIKENPEIIKPSMPFAAAVHMALVDNWPCK